MSRNLLFLFGLVLHHLALGDRERELFREVHLVVDILV